ncbi:hypothetical protein KUCAC02_032823 [Chaenocephalus aceratus]|nr:hypothetical protein KUCAC02_032823 [Chaenocephalus aceratus]
MEGDVSTMAVKFIRREYLPHFSPKMFLLEWSRKEKLQQPLYEMKSKKFAEQAASVVCLRVLGIPEGRIGEESDLVCKRKRDGRTNGTTEEEQSSKRHSGDMRPEEETPHVNGDTPPEKS